MSESATPTLPTYLHTEFLRYKSKGLWVVLGIVLYILAYYVLVPAFLSHLLSFLLTFNLTTPVLLTATVMISHHLCYVLHCALLQVVIYFDWARDYRCNPKAIWPWTNDQPLIERTFKTLSLNFFVLIPVVIYVGMASGQFDFPGGTKVPEAGELFRQILFCMCAEDVWSFVFHRMNHFRLPYRLIHKKHHEYNVSVGMTAEYAHPVEYLLTNIVPVTQAAASIGPIILGQRMLLISFLTWLCYRIGDTVDQHGAYEFPWSPFSILPFASSL